MLLLEISFCFYLNRLWDGRSMEVVKNFPKKQYIQTCCDFIDDGLTCISTSNGFGGHGCEITVYWPLLLNVTNMRKTEKIIELQSQDVTH